jgi:hypothetical protein
MDREFDFEYRKKRFIRKTTIAVILVTELILIFFLIRKFVQPSIRWDVY